MNEARSARFALLPAVMAVSSAALFVRMADGIPLATAFWRGAIAGLCFLPVYLVPKFRAEFRAVAFSRFGVIAAATVIIALHQICFITSLSLTSIAAATFLTSTQPVFTAFLGGIFLGEHVSKRSWLGILGAIAGMGLITYSSGGEIALKGSLLALLAALLASLYSIAARKLRPSTPLVPFMTAVHASGSIFLGLLCFIFGVSLFEYSERAWTGLIMLGLLPTLVGHSLLTYAIGHLRAFVVNASILGEPVGATILAVIFMGEVPPLITLVGGALIVGCILIIVLEKDVPIVEAQLD